MEGLGVGLALLDGHRARRDVGLDADDRLDALGLRGLVEGDRAVQGAVVRDRHRIHALLGRRIDQLRDPAEAVEEAELGVDVEVREVVRGDRHREVNGTRAGRSTRCRSSRGQAARATSDGHRSHRIATSTPTSTASAAIVLATGQVPRKSTIPTIETTAEATATGRHRPSGPMPQHRMAAATKPTIETIQNAPASSGGGVARQRWDRARIWRRARRPVSDPGFARIHARAARAPP